MERQNNSEFKPCPFCGCSLKEHGSAFMHPKDDCILSGTIFRRESSYFVKWQTRTENEPAREPFQSRVKPWMDACFGPAISADKVERNHRFLEEALELVQASGCTREECHQLVDYVYGRPQGDINQEVGGVMVTLAAHCLAHGVDMHEAGEAELTRIWGTIEQIREKQAGKPKNSPLPQTVSSTESGPVNVPDYKRLAYEFAGLLGFCIDNLRPTGTGLVLDGNSGKAEPWRNWIARYIEKLPDMTIDHDVLNALDLPAKARRKRLAEIAEAKANSAA